MDTEHMVSCRFCLRYWRKSSVKKHQLRCERNPNRLYWLSNVKKKELPAPAMAPEISDEAVDITSHSSITPPSPHVEGEVCRFIYSSSKIINPFVCMCVRAPQVVQTSRRDQLCPNFEDDNESDRASSYESSKSIHSDVSNSESEDGCSSDGNIGSVRILIEEENHSGPSTVINHESNVGKPITINASIFRISKYEYVFHVSESLSQSLIKY
jgi:hypothetical protein